uniref:Uncharacterized protein n=1 Tax=Ciona intestinalis TaxID=7719 RepID=H2XYB6_CIOIN
MHQAKYLIFSYRLMRHVYIVDHLVPVIPRIYSAFFWMVKQLNIIRKLVNVGQIEGTANTGMRVIRMSNPRSSCVVFIGGI